MAKAKKQSAPSIMAALAEAYGAPMYAFLQQVRSCTGYGTVRTADAIALSLWPSRGIELIGFEVKISRTDWLKELKQPEKADEICKFCDRWWVVVSSADIVRDGELPPTWGLMIVDEDGVTNKVDAPKLTPESLTRDMFAGIMRKVSTSMLPNDLVEERIAKAVGIEREELKGLREERYELSEKAERVDEILERIAAFQEASGLEIDNRWLAKPIGKTVRAIRQAGNDKLLADFQAMRRSLAKFTEHLDEAVGEIQERMKSAEADEPGELADLLESE